MHDPKPLPRRTPRAAAFAFSLALALAGCKSQPATPDDATLNSQVQTSLASDQNLSGQAIQATVAGGVVTLSGSVSSDTARTIASQDVAQVAGVKTVVNNLLVQAPSATASTRPPAPIRPEKAKKPTAMPSQRTPSQRTPSQRTPSQPAPQTPPPPAPIERAAAPAPPQITPPAPAPPPPPTPVVHSITLPAGTAIPVRITETLDSATTKTGDKFTGAIASDIVVDDLVVLPQGTAVTGHVDAAQDAAHFKGSSLLTISLAAINRKGEHIEVATDPYTREGEGRGKNSAEKVGGGAAVGAILGGILGGGKGAAIGAAAGGGVGAGAQGVTRGQQVQIASETVVRFKLSDSIIVHVTTGAGASANSSAALEHRTDQ